MNDTAPPSSWTLQRVVSDALRALESLREEHGQVFDTPDDVLAALAEEEIGVDDILRRLGLAAIEAKANGIAADQRIADLRARRERFQRQEGKYRDTMAMVMEALIPADKKGNRSFKDAEFTLTLAPGKPKVIITDEKMIPDELVTVTVTRTPDKVMIKQALYDNGEVPGAILSQAPPTLTVRSK